MTAQTKSPAGHEPANRQRSELTDLAQRYGKIGIRALAAALQYASPVKRPARDTARSLHDERFREHAA